MERQLQLQMWRGLIEIKRGLEEKKEGGGVELKNQDEVLEGYTEMKTVSRREI